MKNMTPNLLVSLLLAAFAASSVSGSVGGMDVTVSDAAGRLAYRGRTNADGTFATGVVKPGNYVVQFNSRGAAVGQDQYAIVVGAGRNKVVADSVVGEQFGGGGVAMRLKVPTGTRIRGQVASGGISALGYRVVNGRRYYLVAAETGSNLGPRWMEEGTRSARNVYEVDIDSIREMQYRGSGQNR